MGNDRTKNDDEDKVFVSNRGEIEEHRLEPTFFDRVKEGTMMNPEVHKELEKQRAMVRRMRSGRGPAGNSSGGG